MKVALELWLGFEPGTMSMARSPRRSLTPNETKRAVVAGTSASDPDTANDIDERRRGGEAAMTMHSLRRHGH